MKIALNSQIITLEQKPSELQLKKLNRYSNWQTLDVSVDDIERFVISGYALCGALRTGGIKESNIETVTFLFVDLDNKNGEFLNVNEILELDWVRNRACLVHHTISSTPKKPKLRIIFALSEGVDLETAKVTLIHLQDYFSECGVDKSCIDPSRLYYGSDKGIIYKNSENRLEPVTVENSVEYVEPTAKTYHGHWSIIQDDLGHVIENREAFFRLFFPDITGLSQKTPQRANIVEQWIGEPTYRESSSGKSFEIFFNQDGSITWCDKSDPKNLSGHFIDYYYRYINNNIETGIPRGEHGIYYNTLRLIYAACSIEFDESKYVKSAASETYADFCDNKNGVRHPNPLKFAEGFLTQYPHIYYAEKSKEYFVYNGKFYDKHTAKQFDSYVAAWVRSLFNDVAISDFYRMFGDPIMFSKIVRQLNYILKKSYTIELFQNDTNYIPFSNGLYDKNKVTLIEHTPDILTTYALDFDFEVTPTRYHTEQFTKLLSALISNETAVETLLRWIRCAIALKGSEIGVLAGLCGTPGSGKTAIAESVLSMLKLTEAQENERLTYSGSFHTIFGDSSNFGSSKLLGRKIICLSEFTSFEKLTHSEISKLKDVIGVDSFEVNYNIKYGGEGVTRESIAFMMTSQDIPEIRTEDQGLLRRMFWVKFHHSKDNLSFDFNLLKNNQFLKGLLIELLSEYSDADLDYFSAYETGEVVDDIESAIKNNVSKTSIRTKKKFHQYTDSVNREIAEESDPFVEAIVQLFELGDGRLESSVIRSEIKGYFAEHEIYHGKIDGRLFGKKVNSALKTLYPDYDGYDKNNRVYRGLKLKK